MGTIATPGGPQGPLIFSFSATHLWRARNGPMGECASPATWLYLGPK
jgi:hypothetical protein